MKSFHRKAFNEILKEQRAEQTVHSNAMSQISDDELFSMKEIIFEAIH